MCDNPLTLLRHHGFRQSLLDKGLTEKQMVPEKRRPLINLKTVCGKIGNSVGEYSDFKVVSISYFKTCNTGCKVESVGDVSEI